MKSYTDLEQSKTLAKILPKESADMRWERLHDCNDKPLEWYVYLGRAISPDEDLIPCWSLAALLEVLPKDYAIALCWFNDGHRWRVCVDNADGEQPYHYADTPIDACYEMIVKLNTKVL